jgi:glycine/D-amino acid oxidase-like deaminating enzyme
VAQEAQLLWQDLDAECGGRLGLRTIGGSFLARDAGQMADFADWAAQARPHGVDSRLLSRAETTDLLGGARGHWVGALHTPSDMKAEPWVAVPELARLAREAGVTIVEACAVRSLDRAAGRVAGVVTESGRIRAPSVVLAGGAWSSLFLRRHGVDIPQLSVRSTALATGRVPQVVNTASVSRALAMRPRDDGGVTLAPGAYAELFVGPDAIRHARRYLRLALQGSFDTHLRRPAPKGFPDAFSTPRFWAASDESPFERMRILNPAPNAEKVAELKRRFAQAYPEVGSVPMRAAWAGMIDVLPDVVPVVDRVAKIPGLTVCTGMCGHGFGAGPGFGRIAADLAAGDDPGTDLSRFRMGRFFDGSTLVPGPNL